MYIYPHKSHWQSEFEHEKQLIQSQVCRDITLYHIGSTAIKGLYAKDCIDILGTVEDTVNIAEHKQTFLNIGYVNKGEYGIEGREYFSKAHRKVHLHIFPTGHDEIKRHLHFVNVMQGNLALINELNRIKLHLQSKYPEDKSTYQNEKTYFYRRIALLH